MEVFFPGSSKMRLRFPLKFVEFTKQTTATIDTWQVTPFEVVHPSGAPSFALRVAGEGKTIAYSGDTEWTDVLIQVAQNTDLFICEAYFFEKQVKYHLDYRTLLAHQAELGCRRLVITHMNEDLLKQLDKVDIEYAEDGKRIIL